jgi:hypothetical protein
MVGLEGKMCGGNRMSIEERWKITVLHRLWADVDVYKVTVSSI